MSLESRLALAAAVLLSFPSLVRSQENRFQEKVEVSRVLVDVRVVDGRGDPVRGLEAADFRVLVDGEPTPVDSVQWISGTTPYSEGLNPEEAARAGVAPASAGRRLVFLFQKDFSSSSYLLGLLRMKREALKLLETLRPEDRVAVLSFDSHLKLWLDFTTDKRQLQKAIDHSILFEKEPPEIHLLGDDSLSPHFDYAAARNAASPESALRVVAEALTPLAGTKSVAFFGAWMGSLAGGTVRLSSDYDVARRALTSARAVVFALDVTDADSHTLEVGLQQVAEDTGGFYVRTRDFPSVAMDRLERAIVGYYTLSLERPRLAEGSHSVRVSLTRRKGTVFTTGRYVD